MTMRWNLAKLCLGVTGLLLLTALPAWGQGLRGMQLFSPAEVTPYDHHNGLPANEGFYFGWDTLTWHISRPETAVIGNTRQQSRIVYDVGDDVNSWTQTNTMDTSALLSTAKGGDRLEFGRMFEHYGWSFSAFALKSQTQWFMGSDIGIVFADDPTWGVPSGGRLEGPVITGGINRPLPVIFDYVTVQDKVRTWNVELMGVMRSNQIFFGGYWEFMAGGRYMEVQDTFTVEGTTKNTGTAANDRVRNILGESFWDTDARNNLIGPQLGVRWFRQRGRWILSSEARFFAAFNNQSIRQQGVLGTNLLMPQNTRTLGEPSRMAPTQFSHELFQTDFCPSAEIRVEAKYQLARSFTIRAGWTGMWMDQIARPSGMVEYTLAKDSVMGIRGDDLQDLIINGFTIGLDVNR